MRALIFLLFLIEIYCVYLYIDIFGLLHFFGEIFISALIGLSVIYVFGMKDFLFQYNLNVFRYAFSRAGMAVSGFCLCLPGILSDVIGVLIFVVALFFRLLDFLHLIPKQKQNYYKSNYQDEEIIDVEIIEEKS